MARVEPVDNKIRLHIFVDKSSIEIFANDGKDVFTLLTYPGEAQTGIELLQQKKGTKMELVPGCLNQYGDEEFIVCIAAFAFDGLLCEGYGTSDFGLFAG